MVFGTTIMGLAGTSPSPLLSGYVMVKGRGGGLPAKGPTL